MASPILVTGAAGRVGAVGRTVTELLLRQGKAVRAMVRNEDERAQALRDMGAEVVVGNLLDLDSMHRVIAGCETMYFGMSVSDAHANRARAAERAGGRQDECGYIHRVGKSKRDLSVCGQMRRQKEGFAVPSDAEWSTYDVILLSSRLGAHPNPLANWKHAIFCSSVIRKRSEPVFGGLVPTSPSRLVGSDLRRLARS